MNKKGILFVDDEPNILSGIKRMLRSMRNDFDFHFAESGRSALELMETQRIDVVVSDMRMPGMDGSDFLNEVKQHFPQAVRIMLTGQADEKSVIRTISIVHQFLSKPCDPKKLKDVLARAGVLHDLMTNNHLKELISGIGTLPSLPSVYAELQKVLNDPEASIDDVSAIIEQDIAMAAKLLQLVNSSFFGLYTKVDSPTRAVQLLGLDTIKILALGIQIFSEIKTDASIISIDYLWEHCILVAQCSKKIAEQATENTEIINNCYIAGMLHDIGRLLLVSKVYDTYLPLVDSVKSNNLHLIIEEKSLYNATHGDIGAYLIGLWGFAGDIVEAVAFHNNIASYPADSFNVALAVHLADFFFYKYSPGQSLGEPPSLDTEYIDKLGYTDKIDSWSLACQSIIENSRDDS